MVRRLARGVDIIHSIRIQNIELIKMNSPEDIQVLGKALDAAKSYVDAILMEPLGQMGGILTDTIGYWRLKNQVKLLLKAKLLLEQNNVDTTKILPDVFVPLLEDGSKVEDDELSNLFASLLASHLDSTKQDEVHPSYTKVLTQLSPLDVRLMVRFRNLASDQPYRDFGLKGAPLAVSHAAELVGVSERASYLSCLNLERLGVVERMGYQPPEGHPIPQIFENSMEHQTFRISEYGVAFCNACHYDQSETL